MSVSVSDDVLRSTHDALVDTGTQLVLDLRWWVPDCGDASASTAVQEWVDWVAMTTATGGEQVRALGQDAMDASGTFETADAQRASETRATATTGGMRAV